MGEVTCAHIVEGMSGEEGLCACMWVGVGDLQVAGACTLFFFFFFSTEGSPQPGSGADRARDRTK